MWPATYNIDYHIDVGRHYYSVPYPLIHERLDVRLSPTTVEVFHHGIRVWVHPRSDVPGQHTTVAEHMPKAHRAHLEWSPSRLVHWGATIGRETEALVQQILESRPHPEQGYRSCLGIIHLGQHYEPERVEAAAKRAIKYNTCSFRSVSAILAAGLDRQPDSGEAPRQLTLPQHGNIRGRGYYAT